MIKKVNQKSKDHVRIFSIAWFFISATVFAKTSKIPEKSMEVQGSPGNKVSQNTFKNTHEDDLDKFCHIISHLTSKYGPDFLGLGKLLDRTTFHVLKYLIKFTSFRA